MDHYRTTYRVDYEGKWEEGRFTISRTMPTGQYMQILRGIETWDVAQSIAQRLIGAERHGYVAGYHDGFVNGRVTAADYLPPSENVLAALASEIHVLGLTVRTYNCLRREDINTVAELISKTEDDILDIRNLGEKSFREIKEALADYGLSLRRKVKMPSVD